MVAFEAAQAYVGAEAHDAPLETAAGVRLAHRGDIVDLDVERHGTHPQYASPITAENRTADFPRSGGKRRWHLAADRGAVRVCHGYAPCLAARGC